MPRVIGPCRTSFSDLNADCTTGLLPARLSCSTVGASLVRMPGQGARGAATRRPPATHARMTNDAAVHGGSAVRVLIADDNRLMLEGFRRALEPVDEIEI